MSQHPRIIDVVAQLDLPNPAIPVPFERFAALGNSEDLLERATFWAFYAAWLADRHEERAVTAVQARNDAHTLHRISQEVALRDCVMIQQSVLDSLQREATENELRPHGVLLWGLVIGGFLLGASIMVVIHGGF